MPYLFNAIFHFYIQFSGRISNTYNLGSRWSWSRWNALFKWILTWLTDHAHHHIGSTMSLKKNLREIFLLEYEIDITRNLDSKYFPFDNKTRVVILSLLFVLYRENYDTDWFAQKSPYLSMKSTSFPLSTSIFSGDLQYFVSNR